MPPKPSNTPKSSIITRSQAVGDTSTQPTFTTPIREPVEEVPPQPPIMDPQWPQRPAASEDPSAIDVMMLPRGLPIVVPQGLREVLIPYNLPKFFGSRDDDLATHVERFEEILISSLVTDHRYYLIWFPNTLTRTAYSWYRSHDAGFFTTWLQLQAAFLRYFRPETEQQQALTALNNIR